MKLMRSMMMMDKLYAPGYFYSLGLLHLPLQSLLSGNECVDVGCTVVVFMRMIFYSRPRMEKVPLVTPVMSKS